jgi:helix-turn-helix protein
VLIDQLRAMAEAVPPGGAVLLPRDWLVEALEGAGNPAAQPLAVDLTVADLVALFGKRPSTVRSWLEAGLFPNAFKLRGKTWRVPRSAVEAFQASERTQDGKEPAPLPQRRSGSLSDYRKVRRPA